MLKNAIPFLLVLVGGLWLYDSYVYRKAMSRKEDNEFGKINRVMAHELDAQVTIWGPSTAWVNFDADLIEQKTMLSCFNMGLNGTSFYQYKPILSEFLSYTKQPKYIVFAVFPYEFGTEKGFYELYKFKHHNANAGVRSMISEVQPVYGFKIGQVPFYRLTAYDKQFYQAVFYPENTKSDRLGFAPQDRTGFNDLDVPGPISIDSTSFAQFKAVLETIRAKGITPIVVIPPFEKTGQSQISNLSYFEKTITDLKAQQVKVMNFLYHPICADKHMFYNISHLNAKGAHQFSNAFADSLKVMIK